MHKIADAREVQRLVEANGLTGILQAATVEAMELRAYSDGETVCSMGEFLEGLFVLAAGKLKVYSLLPNGKTMLVRFARPPSLIGDVEWMARYPVKNNVEAVGECRLLVISREHILNEECGNPAFLRFMVKNLSHKLYTFSNASAMNLLYPVENRFASYLLSLLPKEGGFGQVEEIRTSSLTETAEMLGTSYRHLNRVIKGLIESGVLERKKGRIAVLDEERLRRLADHHLYT